MVGARREAVEVEGAMRLDAAPRAECDGTCFASMIANFCKRNSSGCLGGRGEMRRGLVNVDVKEASVMDFKSMTFIGAI